MTRQEKAKLKRARLAELSKTIKQAMNTGMIESETVNEAVIELYSKSEGQSEWKSGWGWNEAGKQIKKGQSGFAIWGRPKKKKKEEEKAEGEEDSGFSGFPIAYVFHAGQVEDMSEGVKALFAKKQAKAKSNQTRKAEKVAVEAVKAVESMPDAVDSLPLMQDEQDVFPAKVELDFEKEIKTIYKTGQAVTQLYLSETRFLEMKTSKSGKFLSSRVSCYNIERGFPVFKKTYFGGSADDDFDEEIGKVDCARCTKKAIEKAHNEAFPDSAIKAIRARCIKFYAGKESLV